MTQRLTIETERVVFFVEVHEEADTLHIQASPRKGRIPVITVQPGGGANVIYVRGGDPVARI